MVPALALGFHEGSPVQAQIKYDLAYITCSTAMRLLLLLLISPLLWLSRTNNGRHTTSLFFYIFLVVVVVYSRQERKAEEEEELDVSMKNIYKWLYIHLFLFFSFLSFFLVPSSS